MVVLIWGWSFILFCEKNPGGPFLKGGHLFFPTISLTEHVYLLHRTSKKSFLLILIFGRLFSIRKKNSGGHLLRGGRLFLITKKVKVVAY